jgi:hypothetical protein
MASAFGAARRSFARRPLRWRGRALPGRPRRHGPRKDEAFSAS